jgi:hypothetical protein
VSYEIEARDATYSYVDRWNGVVLNCPHGMNVSSDFLSNVSLIKTIII